MNRFTKQFGKPICVVLFGIFAGLAAKKKPLPLVILLLLHTAEFFLVGRKVAEDHAIFYDFLESLDGAVATPRGLWRYLGETFRDFGQILRDGIAESNEVMIRNARLEMADIRTLADLLKRAGVANVCQVSLDYLEKYPDTEDVEFTAGPRDNSNAVRENVQVEKGD